MTNILRIGFGGLIGAHGLAHIVGFLSSWALGPDRNAFKTTILNGRLDLGPVGIRALGIVWLFLSIGFVGAAAVVSFHHPWWRPIVAVLSMLSLVLSAVAWPEARIGVTINVVIIAVLSLSGYVSTLR
jgi:hypothetical protein